MERHAKVVNFSNEVWAEFGSMYTAYNKPIKIFQIVHPKYLIIVYPFGIGTLESQ